MYNLKKETYVKKGHRKPRGKNGRRQGVFI